MILLLKSFLFFMMGASFGSFFKLTADRYSVNDLNILKPSHCMGCGNRLKWFNLIPSFSYIFQKAKCSFCGCKIDFSVFLSESFSGLVFLLFFLNFDFVNDGYKYFLIQSVFVLILLWLSIFDLKTRIVPHYITYSSILFFVCLFYNSFNESLVSLGIAFFLMDSLYLIASLLKKYEAVPSPVLVPVFLLILFSFFLKWSFLPVVLVILFYVIAFLKPIVFDNKLLLSFFLLSVICLGCYFICDLYFTFNFDHTKDVFSDIGFIYLFCEVIFYYLVMFPPINSFIKPVSDDSSKVVLGGGDITVFALISLFLGYKLAFVSIFIASSVSLIYILFIKFILKFFKLSYKIETEHVPFIPFLSIGAFVVIFLFK